jgi:mannobiose 2-epimerase
MNSDYKATLQIFSDEMQAELSAILNYWQTQTIDQLYGGFLGKIDENNVPHVLAPKGSVLNARILWTFSAAYHTFPKPEYLQTATRAFQYLIQYFKDEKNGGIFWQVDYNGTPLDTKKQIYALAFGIYGLTEYYKISQNKEALDFATELFEDIEKYSFDSERGGYLEAFTIDWKPIQDLRLSEKDANEKKTMNTHLHILEAYTNLYRITKNSRLKKQIYHLVDIFLHHIINPQTHHLTLFFDEEWHVKSDIISYGHDIEASWLLLEAAEVLDDEELIKTVKSACIKIATAAARGLDLDGGLWYEMENNHLVKEKHWWVQAEAIVGFLNAWQMTGKKDFLDKSLNNWLFVQQHIIDKKNGEWLWGVKADNSPMSGEDKAGFWKCPYHNSRACLEVINRIENL